MASMLSRPLATMTAQYKNSTTGSGQYKGNSKVKNVLGTNPALNQRSPAPLPPGGDRRHTKSGYPTYRGEKSSPGGLVAGFT
ncbi:hypothetical protein FRC0513_00678 [Corynebacterium diphtheriae]|nr:hypothetical protein FRC0084_00656 [Corynebacterium diphtheriae]CAB0853162.1 hypothetical protein FRC0356_00649 [Corynebacterium diphtheriae]CAB0986601.1 hypothetical protein FRC0513_00678 [Corynebacterium diphtheriae]